LGISTFLRECELYEDALFAILALIALITLPDLIKNILQAAKDANRKPGSNHAKAEQKLAREHKTVADRRKDFRHKASTDIGKNQAIVVVEALKVKTCPPRQPGQRRIPVKMSRQKAG
jgi:hypothetical protein